MKQEELNLHITHIDRCLIDNVSYCGACGNVQHTQKKRCYDCGNNYTVDIDVYEWRLYTNDNDTYFVLHDDGRIEYIITNSNGTKDVSLVSFKDEKE
jgi:ribosomal protein L37E